MALERPLDGLLVDDKGEKIMHTEKGHICLILHPMRNETN